MGELNVQQLLWQFSRCDRGKAGLGHCEGDGAILSLLTHTNTRL